MRFGGHSRCGGRRFPGPCLAVALLLCSTLAQARVLDLGLSQEVGYEERLQTEGGSGNDGYSKTTLAVALDHPVVFHAGRVVFDPRLRLSQINYFRFNSLDTFTVELEGPLQIDFLRVGGPADSLSLAGRLDRDLVTVSTQSNDRGTRTTVGLETLYTRYLRVERWKMETGYDYMRTLYDESEYKDLERDTHTLSLAMLYAVDPKLDIGLRGSYAREDFLNTGEGDATTIEIASLGRWRLTGKLEAEVEVGYETVTYRNNDAEDSGLTFRGSLDWQPTPRWSCLAAMEHGFDVTEGQDDARRVTTTKGSLEVNRQITPRFQVGVTPAVNREGGDPRVVEFLVDLSATYAFHWFDLTVQAGVTDRHSQAGGDDQYTATRALVRVDFDF